MKKINIVAHERSAVFTAPYFKPNFERYFNIITFDEFLTGTYSKKDTIAVASNWAWTQIDEYMYHEGYKIVVDNLWECQGAFRREYPEDFDLSKIALEMQSQKFFWFNEYYHYQYAVAHNIATPYIPDRNITRTALMQIRVTKPQRDILFDGLTQTRLDQMLYSYVQRDIHNLPHDIPIETLKDGYSWNTQRYMHPEWYDTTGFTIAVETFDDSVLTQQFGTNRVQYAGPYPFITEKTFKPIMYQHPFVVWGMQNTLSTLKDWGFVTFDNLFDESYDQIKIRGINDPEQRHKLLNMLDNFDSFKMGTYSKETLERIAHNYNRFFNAELIQNLFFNEIITPILNVVENV